MGQGFSLLPPTSIQTSTITDTSNVNINTSMNLDALYTSVGNTNDKIVGAFAHQNETINIVEKEKERLLLKKDSVDSALTNKKREMNLNDNIRKRIARYTDLLVVVIMMILSFLIVFLFDRNFPVIPEFVTTLLMVFIVSVGVIKCMYIIYDISIRDPLYFDELNIPPPPAKLTPQQSAIKNQSGDLLGSMSLGCIGQECCNNQVGTVWDPSSSNCVIDLSNIRQYDVSNNLDTIMSNFKQGHKGSVQGFATLTGSTYFVSTNTPYEFNGYSTYTGPPMT
jgi:uncharacterized membrane protein